MVDFVRNAGQQPLKWLLAIALGALAVQLHFALHPNRAMHSEMMLQAEQGRADMALRNSDFPRTFIDTIHVGLTSPVHPVHISWSGPEAQRQQVGPFHSAPGRGRGDNDCDDCDQSNRGGSHCTPKGTRVVEGFSDAMESARAFKFVTWFHSSREIALHSHPDVPDFPASSGCVRLSEQAAQLIHNNSVAGVTKVLVEGTWTPPPAGGI